MLSFPLLLSSARDTNPHRHVEATTVMGGDFSKIRLGVIKKVGAHHMTSGATGVKNGVKDR